jgi:hypothetical protein
MSEALLIDRPAASDRKSIGERKHELGRTLEAKVGRIYSSAQLPANDHALDAQARHEQS